MTYKWKIGTDLGPITGTLEIDDNASPEEIDEFVKDEIYNHIELEWWPESEGAIKRIAIIEDGYVRDTQIFTGNPDFQFELDDDSFYIDVKYPRQYIGYFTGEDEDEIIEKAAAEAGVHPDIITLIEP